MRILALGDSITRGSGDGYGNYRRPLQSLLAHGGFSAEFVGSNTEQSDNYHGNDPEQTFSPYQKEHEGYGGFRIEQIAGDTPARDDGGVSYPGLSRVLADDSPDIILMMLGTNDINQGYDQGGPGYGGESGFAADAGVRLDALLDKIFAAKPNVALVLATITPLRDAAKQEKVQAYNAVVAKIVATRQGQGQRLVFADMGMALSDADIAGDGVHPTTTGYDKMARVWFSALTNQKAAPVPTPQPITQGQLGARNLFNSSNTIVASASFAPAFVPANLLDGTSKGWVFGDARQEKVSISGFKGAIERLRFFDTPSYTGRTPHRVTISASARAQNSLKSSDYTKIGTFPIPSKADLFQNPTNPTVYADMGEPAAHSNSALSYSDLGGLHIPPGTQSLLLDFSKSGDDGDGLSEIQAFERGQK